VKNRAMRDSNPWPLAPEGAGAMAMCATVSGISYNTLIKLERGGILNPKIETVIKLAEALGVGLDELVGRKPTGSA
jgi:DNA-binding phage protein